MKSEVIVPESKASESTFLFWLDMEMTGLDVEKEKILEVAALVTDHDLKPFGSLEAVVYQSPEVLAGMDEWCRKTHGKSGLVDRVPHGITEAALDDSLCAMLDAPDCPKGRPILAGNSIGQDRKFIDRYLPKFAARLHYRMLDVSSFKIVFEHRLGLKYKKQNKHRALDDVRESIAELQYYLGYIRFDKTADPAHGGGAQ
jgi:oligoribonuclease